MINPSPDGDVEEHLSIDKAMFPTFYAGKSTAKDSFPDNRLYSHGWCIFIPARWISIRMCSSVFECSGTVSTLPRIEISFPNWQQYIHYVFAATCAVKLLYMGLSREKFYHNSRLGYTSEPLVMSQKVFEQVSDSLFLLALLLVSLGWTITSEIMALIAYLEELCVREVCVWNRARIVLARVPADRGDQYYIPHFGGCWCCTMRGELKFGSMLDSSGAAPVNCIRFVADRSLMQLTVYVFRCLYVLSIIVCMNFTHTHTRAYISDLPWNVEVAVLYARLKQYQ
jgi:hypothetical protein